MLENLFKFGSKYFVGVDFGSSTIKIVELSFKDKKIRLENYAWADLNSLESVVSKKNDSQPKYINKLQVCLQELKKKIKLKSKSVYVSLPAYNGLVTMVEFPVMKQDELEKAVQFEARKYIPASLDEVAIDWTIIPGLAKAPAKPSESSEGKNKVLLVAAPKKEVIKYGNIIRSVGLEVNSIELETFSLSRALVGSDLGTFLIIDIGSNATNIVLVDKGTVRVSRNIDTGGNEITGTIADSLKISKQRAEAMKKEGEDIINGKEVSLPIPALEMIANETNRIVSAYKEKNIDLRFDGIILSGGSAKLKGLDQYFSQKIGIKTDVGNPWRRIIYDQKLESFIDKARTSFSVALGLALRGIEETKK